MELHPFMGIEGYGKPGMPVEVSARRLQRIGFVDGQCMHIESGHMIARPEYEIKGALARWIWLDAVHCDQLRSRCRELRMNTIAFDKVPDPGLHTLMQAVLNSPDTLCLLAALFEVVKPAQIESIKSYMANAQPIADQPTLHLLKHQLLDREEQLAWADGAIAVLTEHADDRETQRAGRWKRYIQDLLAAAGGMDGTLEKQTAETSPPFDVRPFELPNESVRDERFRTAVKKYAELEVTGSVEIDFRCLMYNRLFEMSVAEGAARIQFLAEGRPWAFRYDTARHIWDEVRHSWFGEAALRSKNDDFRRVPIWVGFYNMASAIFNPDELYIHLTIAIEQSQMKYPPGKREEWEFCRDVVKDPLMTTFQDFDWADEVVHVGFGKKWVIDGMYGGDAAKAKEQAEQTMVKRKKYMSAFEDGPPRPQSTGY